MVSPSSGTKASTYTRASTPEAPTATLVTTALPRQARPGGSDQGRGHPSTILRATQFFAFIGRIADSSTHDGTVPLPSLLFQPEAADDVAAALADIAQGAPVNGTVELAGPERFRLDELVRRYLSATSDSRHVVTDARAPYYGSSSASTRANSSVAGRPRISGPFPGSRPMGGGAVDAV
jgi:hypothetical protein